MGKWYLSLHPDAEVDALNGYQWYADRNPTAAQCRRVLANNVTGRWGAARGVLEEMGGTTDNAQ